MRVSGAIGSWGGSGGWSDGDGLYGGSGSIGAATGRCDIDVVEGMMASKEFVDKHLMLGRPVLMKKATTSGPWKAWRKFMAKDAFLRTFGKRIFETAAIPCEPST